MLKSRFAEWPVIVGTCLIALVLFAIESGSGGEPPIVRKGSAQARFHPNRILVKPKAGRKLVAGGSLAQLHEAYGAHILRQYSGIGGLQVVQLKRGADVGWMVECYRQSGLVEYAEPDYEIRLATEPNDPFYLSGLEWSLNNTGQSGGLPGADIKAPEAWSIRTQATNVIVAILDSGIRYTHEDLAANVWSNPGEVPGNWNDDDGDGFIDDVHGINAMNYTGDPYDDNGHGTMVAGIIGAAGNNGIGIAGVAWGVQLMGCKMLDANGSGWISSAVAAIDYARVHGANVMNASWTLGYSQSLIDAIESARRQGILFVAAAGNSSYDNDSGFPPYPASYSLDNIVSVAASSRSDGLAYFSNFGQGSVDVAAPGVDIFTTQNTWDGGYGSATGTSVAAPEVSGVFALMRAQFPEESYLELINRVYGSVDPLTALSGKCVTGGRINLAKALGSTSSQPPNDGFANRRNVRGSVVTVPGINAGASKEAGEPDHAGNPGGRSVWWGWRAPSAGVIRFSAKAEAFDPVLAIYTGASVSELTPVASSDGTVGSGFCSIADFDVAGGVEYQIALDGRDGGSGSAQLNVSFMPRPINDAFENRIAITGSVATVSGSNVLATVQPGEPAHAGQASGKTVWWSWTAAANGPAVITTSGSDFNTVLAVYTGEELSNLGLVASCGGDLQGGTGGSSVRFTAAAGTTYQIAVDGYGGASGRILLNTPPLNDNFTNALGLTGVNCFATGFNTLATREPSEPDHAGKGGGKSLWWSWVAPTYGPVNVTTFGSSFDTLLAAYTGSELATLSLVGSNDDANGDRSSSLRFNAVAGRAYYIAVDGADGASGTVQLTVSTSEYAIRELLPPPGCNITSVNAVNSSGTATGDYVGGPPDNRQHGCIWKAEGTLVPISTDESIETTAWDINERGQVVGRLSKPGYGGIAFLWQDGVLTELPGLTQHTYNEAYGIDNEGRIVGWSATPANGIHAVLWQNGTIRDLGAVGTDRSYAYGLNGTNLIIGSSGTADAGPGWALKWENMELSNIALPPGSISAQALGINAFSEATGGFFDAQNRLHAFLWKNGQTIDIGGYNGFDGWAQGNGINNLGHIVGWARYGDSSGLLWRNGRWTPLDSLIPSGSGWQLYWGNKVNDMGQVAGSGSLNGRGRGFVMTPIIPPDPRPLMISPVDSDTFVEGTDIALACRIFPNSDNVHKVSYFQNDILVGESATAPFDLVWRDVPAGEYDLLACTLANSGATNSSQRVHVSVVSNTLVFARIPDQTVPELMPVQIAPNASDPDRPGSILRFALVSGPRGMSVDPKNGMIFWTPDAAQSPSTNQAAIAVWDNGNPVFGATNQFTIEVMEVNRAPVLAQIQSQQVAEGTLLKVISAARVSNPHATLTYRLVNAPEGASIDSEGTVSWRPSEAQGPGTFVILTEATSTDVLDRVNPILSATNSFPVVVAEVNEPPVFLGVPNQFLSVGQVLIVTNIAIDPDIPTNSLTYSLLSGPQAIALDSQTGVLRWRPTVAQAGSSNYIQLRVTDDGKPALSSTQGYAVLVAPMESVRLSIAATGTAYSIQVTGPIGPDYTIQTAATPPNRAWTDWLTLTPEASPFNLLDTNVSSARFYRVRLGP